jgi:hypothetical protein
MWKTIQTKAKDPNPVQLILDMKVRWSSTYMMLDRAEGKKEVCSRLSRRFIIYKYVLTVC